MQFEIFDKLLMTNSFPNGTREFVWLPFKNKNSKAKSVVHTGKALLAKIQKLWMLNFAHH